MSALRLRTRYAALRRRAALRPRREAGQGQSRLRMRRDPARRQEAARVQAVRHASARRTRRWAPAWSRPKAPARRIGPTAASARTPGRAAEGRRVSLERAGPAQARPQERPGRPVPRRGRAGDGPADRGHLPTPPSTIEWLRAGNDQSAFDVAAGRMVMTTDAYVVSPIFFPGGDIGSLAVNGTINDIAMAGARPLYLSASFIIEEGLPFADLKRVATSMGEASRAAGVPIITGDTKVVERGKADKRVRLDRRRRRRAAGHRPVQRRRSPRRRRHRLGHDRRPRRRGHVEAREPRVRDRDTVRHRRPSRPGRRDGRRGRPRAARHARSDARRPRGDAERTRASVRRRLLDRGGGDPGARRGRRRLRVSWARPAQRRQRRQARGDRRARIRRPARRGDEGPSARARNPRSSAGRSTTPIASSRCAPPSAGGGSSTGSPASNCPASADVVRKAARRRGPAATLSSSARPFAAPRRASRRPALRREGLRRPLRAPPPPAPRASAWP